MTDYNPDKPDVGQTMTSIDLPLVGEVLQPAIPQLFCSETIADYAEAMAEAQGAFPEIKKDREVEVKTRKGETYTYSYATLGAILKAVTPSLSKAGIMIAQPVASVDGAFGVFTVAVHKSGQWMGCFMPFIGTPGGNQDLGKAITYLRRYALQALLGITGEFDDDANGPDGHEMVQYGTPGSFEPRGQEDAGDTHPQHGGWGQQPPPDRSAYGN